MIRRAIADVSSICWTSLLVGKDKENGRKVEFEGKEVLVNSATFGYENAINYITSALKQVNVQPINLILVVEGKNSKSLRQQMLAGYKDTRDSRPPEAYEQFNILKERLVEALLAIGASAVTQDGLEADDVIAYLAQNLDGERYIISRDGDLLQLRDTDIHILRNGDLDLNTYGPFPCKFVRLYKALVGKQDETPGAYKFGEKAFLDLYAIFGYSGCVALENLIKQKKIKDLAEDVPELKSLQRIIDSEDMVYKSYAVAGLYPEKVNTMRMPLQWRVGMVKPLAEVTDERLQPYAGRARLVHAGNYEQAIAWAEPLIRKSAVVSLDIETSTPEESDIWLAESKQLDVDDGSVDLGIDVFGSFLVSMSLTFGENNQYTLYFTHKHAETDNVKNLTNDQMRKAVELVPQEIPLIIQNVSFELTVTYQEWCEAWKDNGWHGFLPNVLDTAIMSHYVNENRAKGLKDNSKLLLNYDQTTFDEVTQITGKKGEMPAGGRLVQEAEFEPGLVQQKRRYKMDELTAEHVFHYGCDDTICTIALYNHYRTVMELEKTWDAFIEVEQLPAYLTALAYVQGVPMSMQRMLELKTHDDTTYDNAWGTVRQFLLDNKWEGTVRPEFVSADEFEGCYPDEENRKYLLTSKSDGKRLDVRYRSIACPAHIKEAVEMWSGVELESSARKPAALAGAILEQVLCSGALAHAVEHQDIITMNALIKSRFTGEPVLDLDSPKKMQRLLYDVIGIPPRLVNKLTPTEREKNKPLAEAMGKYNKILNGSSSAEMTPEDLSLIRVKAKTDAFALRWAIKFDATPEQQEILNALQAMATVSTRRSLYYGPYRYVRHWKDGLIHANANQCGAVTRRYSFSKPNFQQLPRTGEGCKGWSSRISGLQWPGTQIDGRTVWRQEHDGLLRW
jgi:5'-3' exonuclease